MSLQQISAAGEPTTRLRELVIVDAACDRYADFVAAAQRGEISLHFCVDGRSAVRLARRFRANAWLVAAELPDMSGLDLVDMLSPHVNQGGVDPLRGGARISLDRCGGTGHSAIFVVADDYRLDEEQRALGSGVAGYLVRPVSLNLVLGGRQSPADASASVVASSPVAERV
jgi:CheY-like chemotaxis protein